MKKPYLIQRNEILRPLSEFKGQRLSRAVSHDYMGASEFEWGALPKSMRRLQELHKQRKLKLSIVPGLTENSVPLRVYHALSDKDFEAYVLWLTEERNGDIRTHDTLENTYFPMKERMKSKYRQKIDLWWDIENDVFWSFDKKFMNCLEEHLVASWIYMDDKAAKAAAAAKEASETSGG